MAENGALEVLQPSSTIHCKHYGCRLPARDCVLRQQKRHTFHGATGGGNRPGATNYKRFTKTVVPLHLKHCASGKCEQGNEIAAALGDVELEPPRKPTARQWKPLLERLHLVPPAPPRPRPAPELAPAIAEEIGEDLDEGYAPAEELLEQRRAEIAAAVLARREGGAVRPPPRAETPQGASSPASTSTLEGPGRRVLPGARQRGRREDPAGVRREALPDLARGGADALTCG